MTSYLDEIKVYMVELAKEVPGAANGEAHKVEQELAYFKYLVDNLEARTTMLKNLHKILNEKGIAASVYKRLPEDTRRVR